ncbi:MAG: DUF3854 domain-containing protein [Microthrixaceae bacterium]|nr:DUF3854 domain-containing protein [Microthrixaceae bacterium]
MSITPKSVEATSTDTDYVSGFTPSSDGLPGEVLTSEHRAYLTKQGITSDYLDLPHAAETIRSVSSPSQLPESMSWKLDKNATGILYGFKDPRSGKVTWQFRNDNPRPDDAKYLYEHGSGSPVGLVSAPLVTAPVGHTVIIAEGTKQSRAVASAVAHDPTIVVVSISGCRGGLRNGNLQPGIHHVIKGAHRVVCIFDADASNNTDVYTAAEDLGNAVKARMHGRRRVVSYAQVAALTDGATSGIDDVLAQIPALERPALIDQLLDEAIPAPSDIRPSRDPRRKRNPNEDAEDAHRFYHPFAGGLRTKTCADDICDNMHLGIDEESRVIYRYEDSTGLYVRDGNAGTARGTEIIQSALVDRLGEDYRSSYVSSVEEAVRARLNAEGRVFTDEPDTDGLLPVRNGLLDMETGRLIPHTPDRFVVAKLDVDYDPDATCPEFDTWLSEATRLPSGIDQAAIVLDTLTTLLDTASGRCLPDKALFLKGPSRGGKGTLGNAVVSSLVAQPHRTAMSLADMAKDRPFDNAKLYRKLLNISGETADEYIKDVSLMKRVFGGDPIPGELKFGKSWDFYNRAAMIFMGNDIPHVDDTSGAFAARLTPVVFPHSNVGKEDRGLGKRLSAERSGILNRLLDAWRERHLNRNSAYLPPAPEAMEEFITATNPVASYINEYIDIAPKEAFSGTKTVDTAYATTRMDLYSHYANTTRANGGIPRKREKFERDIARTPFNIRTDAVTPSSDGCRKVVACRIRPVEVSNSISMSTQHGVTVAIPASTLVAEMKAKNTRATTDENTDGDDPFAGGSTVEPAPEPTPPTPPAVASDPRTDDVPSPRDNPALARCGDVFWKLVTERGKPVELNRTGFEKLAVQRTVNSTPASVTITELSEALNLTPEYARGYLRAVHQKLADAGVTLLERRLAKPNTLGAEEPLTGEFVKKPEKAELKLAATEAKKKVTAAAAEGRTAAKAVRAAERALAQAEKRKVSPEELETHQMTLQSANTALSEAEDKLTAANQTAERTRDLAANGDYLQFERMAYVVLLNPNDFPPTITKDN